jgi:hypothetical protein
MRARRSAAAALLAALLCVPAAAAPARGQLSLAAEVVWAPSDVWRGITRTERDVLRPAAMVGLHARNGILTAGVGGVLETTEARRWDATLAGAGARGWGEVTGWLQYDAALPVGDVVLGAVGYRYPGGARADGGGDARGTGEVYAEYRPPLRSPLLHPAVRAFQDVGGVGGAYVEVELGASLPLVPLPADVPGPLTLLVRSVAGFSAGSSAAGGAACTVDACRFPAGGHFAADGLTHVGASATLSPTLSARVPLTLYLTGHGQWNRDARTRLRPAGQARLAGEARASAFWAEVGLRATTRP